MSISCVSSSTCGHPLGRCPTGVTNSIEDEYSAVTCPTARHVPDNNSDPFVIHPDDAISDTSVPMWASLDNIPPYARRPCLNSLSQGTLTTPSPSSVSIRGPLDWLLRSMTPSMLPCPQLIDWLSVYSAAGPSIITSLPAACPLQAQAHPLQIAAERVAILLLLLSFISCLGRQNYTLRRLFRFVHSARIKYSYGGKPTMTWDKPWPRTRLPRRPTPDQQTTDRSRVDRMILLSTFIARSFYEVWQTGAAVLAMWYIQFLTSIAILIGAITIFPAAIALILALTAVAHIELWFTRVCDYRPSPSTRHWWGHCRQMPLSHLPSPSTWLKGLFYLLDPTGCYRDIPHLRLSADSWLDWLAYLLDPAIVPLTTTPTNMCHLPDDVLAVIFARSACDWTDVWFDAYLDGPSPSAVDDLSDLDLDYADRLVANARLYQTCGGSDLVPPAHAHLRGCTVARAQQAVSDATALYGPASRRTESATSLFFRALDGYAGRLSASPFGSALSPSRYCIRLLLLLSFVYSASATEDGESSSSTSRPPVFTGERGVAFTTWLIAFHAWLAWKLTDALPLVDDPPTVKPPDPPAAVMVPGKPINEAVINAATAAVTAWTAMQPPMPPAQLLDGGGNVINQADIDAANAALGAWLTARPADPPAPIVGAPNVVANQADIDDAKAAQEAWVRQNRRLFGVLITAIPSWLATSLTLSNKNDGVGALKSISAQFDVVNQNDRASAIAKVQGHYIDSKADLAESDLRLQHDSMLVANAEIVRAGGTAFPDELLISMFDNSLPESYTQIRQLVRRSGHATFAAHYDDYRATVRAELDARSAAGVHAFAGFLPRADGGAAGGGSGGGRGGFGRRGGGRGGGRDGGRGGGRNGGGHERLGSTNCCLRCLRTNHTRGECREAPRHCETCANHADHHPSICPHGQRGNKYNSLSNNARRLLTREAGQASAAPALAATTNAQPPQAMAAPAPTQPAAPAPPAVQPPPAPQPHANAAQADADDPANAFVRAIRGYCATLSRSARSAPRRSPPVPSDLRRLCPSVTMYRVMIDSMASLFILREMPHGFRITNPAPRFRVAAVKGEISVQAVGETTIYLRNSNGVWHHFAISGVLIVPDAEVDLYSTRVMRAQHHARHNFDSSPVGISMVQYQLEGGQFFPFDDDGAAYFTDVGFGPPVVPARAAMCAIEVFDCPTDSDCALPIVAYNGQVVNVPATHGTPQATLWHRVGFPHEQSWRYLTTMTANHGQPGNMPLASSLDAPDAVMRGRARARPLVERPLEDTTLPAPGAVLYMDFAGPMVPSQPHRFTGYSGIICAGSGYARAYPVHRFTQAVARQTYEAFVADLSSKMGLVHPLKPQVVVTDQGSAYMARYFREFLDSSQTLHRPAVAYQPRQNPFIERLWGAAFGTARVLLTAANLPPTFHPHAVQTAVYLHNRLPRPSHGNVSPYFTLTRQLADLFYLRTFGCLCVVTIPSPRRTGDHHFHDRGAAGLYMGPSETSPGSVVYLLSSRSLTVTRDLVCYEDRFPGSGGVRFDWAGVLTDASADGGVGESPLPLSHDQQTLLNDAPSAPDSRQSAADSAPAPVSTPQHRPSPHTPGPSGPPAPSPSVLPSPHSPAPRVHTRAPPTAVTRAPPTIAPTPLKPSHTGAPVPPPAPIFDAVSSSHAPPPVRRSRRQFTQATLDNISEADQRATRYERVTVPTRALSCCPALSAAVSSCLVYLMVARTYNLDRPFCYVNNTEDITGLFDGSRSHTTAYSVTHTAELGDVPVPRGYAQAMKSEHASYWREAVAKEIQGLLANDTFQFVLTADVPRNANIMGSHIVFALKRLKDGSIDKFKARCVADGNTQKYGVDFDRVFSTVVKATTIRLLLCIAAARDYNLTSVDVRQAYLQATLKEDLYMRVPPGLPREDNRGRPLTIKLRKSLYGLKQAGREWNTILVAFLLSFGFVQSKVDVCMFTLVRGALIMILLCWVDDLVIADNDSKLRAAFVKALALKFPLDDKGDCDWIIGLRVERDRPARSISISQALYVADLLHRHSDHLTHARRYTSPMDDKAVLTSDDCPDIDSAEYHAMGPKRHEYMSMVGGILWLANMTMFELSYAASQLARFVSNPGKPHFDAAVRVLLYLKHATPRTLYYRPNVAVPLTIYVDSNWATKFSASGALFYFNGCLIHWFSKLQRSISYSSTEAELFGAILAAKEGQFLRHLLAAFDLTPTAPTVMFSDNKSCIDLSFDPVAFKKTKHIMLAAEGLRDLVLRLVFVLKYVAGKVNVADILTKAQAPSVFVELMAAHDAIVGTPQSTAPASAAP